MISTLRRHPSDVQLKRQVDAPSPVDGKIAAHVERCGPCAQTVAAYRRISATAQTPSAVPAPPAGMLERILAQRAAGERVLLPAAEAESTTHPPAFRRAALVAVAAAATVAAAVVGTRPHRPAGVTLADAPHAGMPGLGLLPTPAYAAEAQRTPRFPAPAIDGRRIRPGVWAYEYRVSRNGRALAPPEAGAVRVTPVRTGAGAAWRMSSGWTGHAGDMRETVDFDAATLRPLHRSAGNVGPSRYVVEQWTRGDSLLGTMASAIRHTRTRIARRLPPGEGPYLMGESSPLLLFQAVELRPGWRARIALLGWGSVTTDLMYPLSLRVTGQGHLRGPLGTDDCWLVEAAFGRSTRTLWVRKRDGVTLLSRDATPNGALSEVVLVRESPASARR
jgi:hypothetical protein